MEQRRSIEEYKGHVKDMKNPFKISHFIKDDNRLLLAIKKTERLSEALYMVTDLFEEREPLRWEIRKKIVQLMSFMTELPSVSEAGEVDASYRRIHSALSEVLFPLELAMKTRLISPMNFSILKDEFTSLGEILHARGESLFSENDISFPQNFFSYEEKVSLREGAEEVQNDREKVVFKKTDTEKQKDKIVKDKSKVSFKKTKGHTSEDKTGRRTAILQLLKAKGELTIKEISAVLDSCSEKTIQRELTALINEGVVLKEGQRRWSKYLLA